MPGVVDDAERQTVVRAQDAAVVTVRASYVRPRRPWVRRVREMLWFVVTAE